MNNKPADYERGIKRARAFMAFLSAALVLIGQTMLFTTPAKQETGIPVPFWLSMVGILLFAASLSVKPPKFLAVYFDRLSLDGVTPWVLAAVTLSVLATLSMILFQGVPDQLRPCHHVVVFQYRLLCRCVSKGKPSQHPF
jgi:hypothetical protein